MESMLVRRSLQAERRVGLIICNQSRSFAVSLDGFVVSIDLFCGDGKFLQFCIKPEPSPGACISVGKTDSWLCKIRDLLHIPRVSTSEHESLRAVGKRDNFHSAVGEQVTDERRVVFSVYIQ